MNGMQFDNIWLCGNDYEDEKEKEGNEINSNQFTPLPFTTRNTIRTFESIVVWKILEFVA